MPALERWSRENAGSCRGLCCPTVAGGWVGRSRIFLSPWVTYDLPSRFTRPQELARNTVNINPFYQTQHDHVSLKKRCTIKNINLFCLSLIDAVSSDTQLQVFTKKSPAWHIQWNWQSSENWANEKEGLPVFKIFLSSRSVKFFCRFQYNPSINILKYTLSLKKHQKLFKFLLNFL